MSHAEQLVRELQVGDRRHRLLSLELLINYANEAVEPLIHLITSARDFGILWTLDGFDYEEEQNITSHQPEFDMIQAPVEYKYWCVPASARMLIRFGNLSAKPLIAQLQNHRSTVRALIAYLLGEIGDISAIDGLLDCLKTEDYQERVRVIEALGKLHAVSAVDPISSCLPIEELTFDAAVALGRIHDLRALNPLVEQFKHSSFCAHAIGAALYSLGRYTVEPLIAILEDQNVSHAHAIALEVLGRLGDDRAIEAILSTLTNTIDSNVIYQGVIALGKLKARSALGFLVDTLKTSSDPNIPFRAVEAIAAIGGDAAFNIFVDFLENGPFILQYQALLGLAQMAPLENIQPMLTALQSADPRIRSTAAVQLANLRDIRSLGALKVASNDPDWRTRVSASAGLQQILGKSQNEA